MSRTYKDVRSDYSTQDRTYYRNRSHNTKVCNWCNPKHNRKTAKRNAINWLEPELTNEQILAKLVIMLTPMCETPILNALNSFLNSLGQKKLDEVNELFAQFFDETTTENNN